MLDDTICHFVPIEDYWDEAKLFFQEEKNNLLKILDNFSVSIEHFGGSSIPGSLTKRDVDIQIRTQNKDFLQVVEKIKYYADIKRKDLWTENLALFKNDSKTFPVDYIITTNGSEAEQYYFGGRDLLLKDPKLLIEYNNLKKSFEGKQYKNYREAKTNFWRKTLKEKLGLKNVH